MKTKKKKKSKKKKKKKKRKTKKKKRTKKRKRTATVPIEHNSCWVPLPRACVLRIIRGI